MSHKIQVRKSAPKVSSINICLPSTLWEEKSVAPRTKDVHGIISWQITQANWQDRLTLTKDLRTSSKGGGSVFFVHGVHPSVCHDITRMNQTVQHFGSRLDNFLLLLRIKKAWNGDKYFAKKCPRQLSSKCAKRRKAREQSRLSRRM